ncbi:MAG: hypothetical protein KAQ63_01670 [Candidatus Moranbacteria bacterium]|nr:hypothetical protein [Candidatus Moranbacteria bacterium]
MKSELDFLFGSRIRWRLIKFFMLNEKVALNINEILGRNKLGTKNTKEEAKKILSQLVNAKFIYPRTIRGQKAYFVNTKYSFYDELKWLVVKSNIYPQCEQLNRVKNLGDVKLGLVSGIFINNKKSKTDLLLVVDSLSRAKFKHLIEDLEAEMGQEINYSLMNLEEFRYRIKMFDKFILEILEQPHEIIMNEVDGIIKEIKRSRKR